MMILRICAPFATCRPMAAGWHRPTTSLITPSAIYGLLLNFACIESRLLETDEEHSGKVPATLIRSGLPKVKLALGIPADEELPHKQTIFQQLHNYPVGGTAGVAKELAMGTKNNITPVRREFLSKIRLVILADENPDLEDRIRQGLNGQWNDSRYGLPFLGDNAFMLDRIEELESIPECRWYEKLDSTTPPKESLSEAARLTVSINRTDMTQTESALFAPASQASSKPSEKGWTWINPQ